MKKKFIFSASAAALLALAPTVTQVSNTIVNAASDSSITLSAGNGTLFKKENNGIKIDVTNANEIKPGASIDTIETQITPDSGNATLASNGSAYVVPANKADDIKTIDQAKANAVTTVNGGHTYRIIAFNVQVSDLNKDQSYKFNGKDLKPDKDGKIILDRVTSDNFVIVDHSQNIQPYFTQIVDGGKSSVAIPNGGTANAVSTNGIATAEDAFKAAKNAVTAHAGTNAGESQAIYETTIDDVKKQLTDQKIQLADNDSFLAPSGYLIKLTIANNVSGKTATVTVPFGDAKVTTDNSKDVDKAIKKADGILVNGEAYTTPQTYVVRAGQFSNQNGIEFKDINGKTIQFTNVSKAEGADFEHAGTYTVTLTGATTTAKVENAENKATASTTDNTSTDTKTTDKASTDTTKSTTADVKSTTTTAAYTLIVLPSETQHVYANGEKSVPTYDITNGKVNTNKTTLKDKQEVKVLGNTKDINGVSYTEIEVNGQKLYIRTTSLTQFTKDTAGSETLGKATKRTVMHASYVYNEKGKRANKSDIRAYSTLDTYGSKVTIGKKEFYKIDTNRYVKANNITGVTRKVTSKKNTPIYNLNGNYVRSPKNKKQVLAIKPNTTVTTYGGSFKISKSKIPVYRVAKGQYVKASDLTVVKTAKKSTTTKTNTSTQKTQTNNTNTAN